MSDIRTIRVNDLDNWRYHLAYKTPVEDFIKRMQRTHTINNQMSAGRAFHSMLKMLASGDPLDGKVRSGTTEFLTTPEMFEGDFSHPMRVEGELRLPSAGMLITGQAHMLDAHNRTLYEFKSTWAPIDIERFRRSFQWRYYLRMFDCDTIVYRAWRLRKLSEGVHRVIFTTSEEWGDYDQMDSHLHDLAASLADFLDENGLWPETPQHRKEPRHEF